MIGTTYDKINNRIKDFWGICSITRASRERRLPTDIDDFDEFKITFEIDQFVKENPKTFEKYITKFLSQYLVLQKHLHRNIKSRVEIQELINNFDKYPDFNNLESIHYYGLSGKIDKIVNHLNGLLNPEPEIQEPPQKVEKLKPFEKIIIFHYLNEKNKLFKYPLNSKSGKYFLSRLLDINPESIKNPVDNITDYTTNKVTEKQAEPLFKTLEKVKSFFHNSDLYEISESIELRIKELKRISGKD
jgi:hypothetical protein